jgi:hypothetical protein
MVRHFPRSRPQQKPVNWKAGYILTALFFFLGLSAQAQTGIEPTSATDADVKIHNSRKIFLFGSSGRAHGTERQGQSLHKRNHRARTRAGKEAQVFRSHNHFARKENTRSRHRNTKRHT